jgi:hypothetical protein
MKTSFKIAAALIATVSINAIAMAATPLQSTATTTAARTTTGTQTATVSGSSKTATTTTAPSNASAVTLAQFDTANGILTGANVAVKTTVRVTAGASGTVKAYGSNRTIASDVSLTGTIATPGVIFNSSAITATASCSSSNCSSVQSQNASSVTFDKNAAVPVADLASYAGTGNVTFTRSAAGSTKVTTGSGANSGTADGSFTFGSSTQANNVYTIVYDYLNFANPSFSGSSNVSSIDLDFGSLQTGSGPMTLNFSIFNLGDVNSAGVSLNSIVRSNNNTDFTTTLANFTDLVAGASSNFSMTFLPTALGLNAETFTLDLADYAPVGSVGTKTYQLKVNTIGNVLAPPPPPVTSVPEPQVWAMLIVGFGLTGYGQRRRRARMAVAA